MAGRVGPFNSWSKNPGGSSDAAKQAAKAQRQASKERKLAFYADVRKTQPGIPEAAIDQLWEMDWRTRSTQKLAEARAKAGPRVPTGRFARNAKGGYLLNPNAKHKWGTERVFNNAVDPQKIGLRATGYDIQQLTRKKAGKKVAKYINFLGPGAISQFVQFDAQWYRDAATITQNEVMDFIANTNQPWRNVHPELREHWNSQYEVSDMPSTRASLAKTMSMAGRNVYVTPTQRARQLAAQLAQLSPAQQGQVANLLGSPGL